MVITLNYKLAFLAGLIYGDGNLYIYLDGKRKYVRIYTPDVSEVENEVKRRGIPADVFRLEELEYFKGEINPRCYENYGDVMVIAKKHVCFKYPFEKDELQGLGVHGGLSDSERIINLWEYEKHT